VLLALPFRYRYEINSARDATPGRSRDRLQSAPSLDSLLDRVVNIMLPLNQCAGEESNPEPAVSRSYTSVAVQQCGIRSVTWKYYER
jgi:hypothetical protein